jgi:glycosyltransferase involved in cell wall biosynthesis
MPRLNIMVIGNFHSHPSAEAFLDKFIDIIINLSDNCFLISGDLPSRFLGKIFYTKTKALVYPYLPNFVNYLINQLKAAFFIIKYSLHYKIDVIIFLAPPIIPMLIAKLLGLRIIRYQGGSYSKQTFGDKKSKRRYLFSWLFETMPAIISDTILIESKASLSFQNLDKYKDKIMFGMLYVDTTKFKIITPLAERDHIGYVGSLNENKGVDKFCDSLKLIREDLVKKGLRVLIVGDGELYGDIENKIDSYDLSKLVDLVGWIPHDELPYYLNKIKLLIIPSISEGLPNIALEAMSCGTVILSTPVGGLSDIVEDGITGFILENNSPECIAKNIMRCLRFSNLKFTSENAMKLIIQKYSYDQALERYYGILNNEME